MKSIEQMILDYHPDYANGNLEQASMILEYWAGGGDIEIFRDKIETWMKSVMVGPGLYRRSPTNPMQSSHDSWLGLAVLSKLYDLDVSSEILDEGLCLGMWITGKAHDSFLWGLIPIDSEYFVNFRPSYRAYMKLSADRRITKFEKWALESNLTLSTTYNLLRVRLLFLSYLGYKNLTTYTARLGVKYRGRYGDNPVYNELWELNGGSYGAN